MAVSSTSLTSKSRKAMKPRGKAARTLLLEAIEKVTEGGEVNFYEHMVERAVNPKDPASGMLLKEVLSRMYPQARAVMPKVEFTLPKKATQLEQAEAIMQAVAEGKVTPDAANMLIGVIKDVSTIEANTELKERIEAIESSLGVADE